MTSGVNHRQPVLLVTGATGQVGGELVRELAPLGTVVAPPRSELDLLRPDTLDAVIDRYRPAVVINAAAYTAVDKAESEREPCRLINGEAPGVLANAARRNGAALIHYSTDFVFDGAARRPYRESDDTAPLNWYGETKLQGERAVAEAGGSWLVLRTSWVYGLSGRNFLNTVLGLARTREALRIVDDQVGAPTWSRSIAVATRQILERARGGGGFAEGLREKSGVYHLTAGGHTTWHGFACAILERDSDPERRVAKRVEAIPSSSYPTPARRPKWSVLNSDRAEERFGVRIGAWETELDRVLGCPSAVHGEGSSREAER